MKKVVYTLVCFGLLVAIASCKKNQLGGDATLVVKPAHHGDPIYGTSTYPDSAFVKFNATELPDNPTTNYDALFVGSDGHDHIHCAGFRPGNYFIYVTGLDTTGPDERVSGGVAVKIKYKERKQEITVDVPVTE